ncbi:TetR/AcrR family transcriptional regulator [Spirosoma spitsbergense]|uniref:TetR/AcrR family transcriptional regulator n=1 Tax=Spirosoma spitsbergense TaxID=431554 RepID=UPI000373D0E7|nr:TetR/AcrR family transcriptional regulator [Spirosoma spitsbergense]
MDAIHRNRPQTTQRIINALEQVIDEWGLLGISVNRVAEKAGVSKVLIYRYFGGIDGLMEYYVKKGKLFPIFTPDVLANIRPLQKSDLARVWYRQVIQLYRPFRTSRTSREILKAALIENDSMATVTSQAVEEEMTRLVAQLSFVKGADSQAVSAVILSGMSYLTIMAHKNRSVIGLDLRSEVDWKRIEDAVKLLYIALNKTAIVAENVTLTGQTVHPLAGLWP